LSKIGAKAVAAAELIVVTLSSQNLKNMGKNSLYTIFKSNKVT